MSDFMELGSSGFIIDDKGNLRNIKTGILQTPEGKVFNKEGQLIFDPEEEADHPSLFDPSEYEFFNDKD